MDHSASHIRRQAERLLDAAGISREPVSLRDVVSALNLELVQTTSEPFSCEAALERVGDGRAIVLHEAAATSAAAASPSPTRSVTSCCIPGAERPERDGVATEAMRGEEREADLFAAELLMPEHLVREAVVEQGADVALLADRFQVSAKAMRLRLDAPRPPGALVAGRRPVSQRPFERGSRDLGRAPRAVMAAVLEHDELASAAPAQAASRSLCANGTSASSRACASSTLGRPRASAIRSRPREERPQAPVSKRAAYSSSAPSGSLRAGRGRAAATRRRRGTAARASRKSRGRAWAACSSRQPPMLAPRAASQGAPLAAAVPRRRRQRHASRPVP